MCDAATPERTRLTPPPPPPRCRGGAAGGSRALLAESWQDVRAIRGEEEEEGVSVCETPNPGAQCVRTEHSTDTVRSGDTPRRCPPRHRHHPARHRPAIGPAPVGISFFLPFQIWGGCGARSAALGGPGAGPGASPGDRGRRGARAADERNTRCKIHVISCSGLMLHWMPRAPLRLLRAPLGQPPAASTRTSHTHRGDRGKPRGRSDTTA